MVMKLLEERSGRVYEPGEEWKLDDFLALPDDTRAELVGGFLRLMVRASTAGRQVQHRLTYLLESQCPAHYLVALEEVVVLAEDPPLSRIPDLSVFAQAGKDEDTNYVTAEHVLLAVEIVSPGSEVEDRQVKPTEYAACGIPHYWRVELKPQLAVHTYVLTDGVYLRGGVFGPGDRIKSVSVDLGWVDLPVDQLLLRR